MVKKILFPILLIPIIVYFFLNSAPQVDATNGCGGSSVCNSTVVHNSYTCSLSGTTCSRVFSGTYTSDCHVSENDCWTNSADASCALNGDECVLSIKSRKSSCCGSPGGGGAGGGNCNGIYTVETSCVDPDRCKNENGGRCDINGNVWCSRIVCGACPATTPVIDPITTTATTATISWTATGGTSTKLYITTDSNDFNHNCAGTNFCVFKGNAPASPYTVTGLTPGVKYYVKVLNSYVQGQQSCNTEATADFTTSCTLIAPPSLSMKVGDPSQAFVVNLNPNNTGLTVGFVATPSGIIDFSTNQGNAGNGYQTNISAVAAGPTTITSFVTNPSCQAQTSVNITNNNAGAWWQVKDADLSANGDINSSVPDGQYFDLDGSGGYPGVPTYSSASNLTNTNVSLNSKWLAQSTTVGSKNYDYQFFANQVPTDTVTTTIPNGNVDGSFFESGGTLSYGYYWYKYTGSGTNLSIDTPVNLTGTDRKVILLVEGTGLTIKGNINLTDGREFFGAFVNGAIDVDPLVTSLEGIYLADSTFSTGAGNTKLTVRGSVATYGGTFLQRDLATGAGNTGPAELFEYAPDQILMFPTRLGARKISWKEIAP